VGEYGHDTASEVPAQEVALAEKFMESLRAPFQAEQFQDNYKEQVLALIETKRAGMTPAPGAEKRRLAPVVDLMSALKASLDAVRAAGDGGEKRKPAAKKKAAAKKPAGKAPKASRSTAKR